LIKSNACFDETDDEREREEDGPFPSIDNRDEKQEEREGEKDLEDRRRGEKEREEGEWGGDEGWEIGPE
jgi:hypothetical protein